MHMPEGSIWAEKPENHKVLIVRIPQSRVHTNADTLELFDILGYQLVAKKGNYAAGDLAVYIQPDSVVPQTEPFKWLWEEHVGINGTVPEKRRRITVKRLRKEYSEGLLMPIRDFVSDMAITAAGVMDAVMFDNSDTVFREGDDVSDVLGITHWEGEAEGDTYGQAAKAPRVKRRPKTVMGWLRYFYYNTVRVLTGGRLYRRESSMEVKFHSPEYDVVSQKAARSGFANGELVTVTEKLHGSNARFLFLDGVFYIGSHFQWKSPDTPCIFTRVVEQQPWIREWCEANPGRILYGEVIGDQKKDGVAYAYGLDTDNGELGFRAFDIWEPTETWTKPWKFTVPVMKYECVGVEPLDAILNFDRIVPILYTGLADLDVIKKLTDGKSDIDKKTQREGVVISERSPAPEGIRRPRQVKRVSNIFLEGDSK